MQSSEIKLSFWRNVSSPPTGPKSKPNKNQGEAGSKQTASFLLHAC
jgi:hypothetical protein